MSQLRGWGLASDGQGDDVKRVKALRWAEKNGDYEQMLTTLDGQ